MASEKYHYPRPPRKREPAQTTDGGTRACDARGSGNSRTARMSDHSATA
ncbi:MAG TPA: hypothetical protein VF527_05150 [Pyrinomonadaceae bacterium]|jgi:hypothetical protein